MSLEVSVLYLEKNGTTRTHVTNLLLAKGFNVKAYGTLHSALRFTKPGEHDLVIANLRLNEYERLFRQAKKAQTPVALAFSNYIKYEGTPVFNRIIDKDYQITLLLDDWYESIRPEDSIFAKKARKQ